MHRPESGSANPRSPRETPGSTLPSYIRCNAVKEMHRNNCSMMSGGSMPYIIYMLPNDEVFVRWNSPDFAFLLAQSNSRPA
jgi:hypothetical protein